MVCTLLCVTLMDTSPRRASRTTESRPVYANRLAPCNNACPAGENIQAWLAEAQAGHYREAWNIIVRDNPLPAVHGRVCYHPCEGACNRAAFDGPVTVHAIERFLGDLAIEQGWTIPPTSPKTGKRVLIVGSGPAGLSAAWHLALLGHRPVIYEAAPKAGGLLRYGIPRFRLPREILDAEIIRIVRAGVDLVLNNKITDLAAAKADGGFDGVFVATGAHLGKRQVLPTREGGPVLDALTFFRDLELTGDAPSVGKRVAVYGGGNTAMDASRTARRLGADVSIVYRRTRAQMPALEFEAVEAIEEGVDMHWLRTMTHFERDRVQLGVMRLDEHGYPQPTGESDELEADSVILALGQNADTGFLHSITGVELASDGTVSVNGNLQTGCPGIFAGGDVVPFDRTVTTATGHGKKAARAIHAWLQGASVEEGAKADPIGAESLRRWYYMTTPAGRQERIDIDRRCTTFDEVVNGFDRQSAWCEAQRCLSCGNCFQCDGCYAACPESAIAKIDGPDPYIIDMEKCTGCGLCVDQCPCGAMAMANNGRTPCRVE